MVAAVRSARIDGAEISRGTPKVRAIISDAIGIAHSILAEIGRHGSARQSGSGRQALPDGRSYRLPPCRKTRKGRGTLGIGALDGPEVDAAGVWVADDDGEELPKAPAALGQSVEERGETLGGRRLFRMTEGGRPTAVSSFSCGV